MVVLEMCLSCYGSHFQPVFNQFGPYSNRYLDTVDVSKSPIVDVEKFPFFIGFHTKQEVSRISSIISTYKHQPVRHIVAILHSSQVLACALLTFYRREQAQSRKKRCYFGGIHLPSFKFRCATTSFTDFLKVKRERACSRQMDEMD